MCIRGQLEIQHLHVNSSGLKLSSALRVELADLRERLKRFKAMESVLAETGRLPRARSTTRSKRTGFKGTSRIQIQGVIQRFRQRRRIPFCITPVEVLQGQWWRVVGDAELVQYVVDGYQVQENRLTAQAAELLCPWASTSCSCFHQPASREVLGEVKARVGLGDAWRQAL